MRSNGRMVRRATGDGRRDQSPRSPRPALAERLCERIEARSFYVLTQRRVAALSWTDRATGDGRRGRSPRSPSVFCVST